MQTLKYVVQIRSQNKYLNNLAMTSLNVYVHCFIHCYEYLAPPTKKLQCHFLTYTMHFKKCPAVFSHMRMELLFNPLRASKKNIVTRDVLAALTKVLRHNLRRQCQTTKPQYKPIPGRTMYKIIPLTSYMMM